MLKKIILAILLTAVVGVLLTRLYPAPAPPPHEVKARLDLKLPAETFSNKPGEEGKK